MEIGEALKAMSKENRKFFNETKEGIPVEDFLPEGVVILSADPMPDKTLEEMKEDIENLHTTQELVDAYVQAHNKFWFIEDDIDDYEEGTEEYENVRASVAGWAYIMKILENRVWSAAREEGILAEYQLNARMIKQIKPFMKKYGYRDGCGWWVKIENQKRKEDKGGLL